MHKQMYQEQARKIHQIQGRITTRSASIKGKETVIETAVNDEATAKALRKASRSGTRYDSDAEAELARVLRRYAEGTARCKAEPQVREASELLKKALGPG